MEAFDRSTKTKGATHIVVVEIVSYENNIFRIRFDPSNPTIIPPNITFGPVKDANLALIRQREIANDKAPSASVFHFSDNTLTFSTGNLTVIIAKDFYMTVKDKASGVSIHRDIRDSNGYSLGATFSVQKERTKVATVKQNNQNAQNINERFYGQGQVNVHVYDKNNPGLYTLSKTGLSMTNFNYDQILYKRPELLPSGYDSIVDRNIPNYYLPMYFAAPWIITVGNQGQDSQYAYGLFLNNPSQSYTNTGDANLGCGDPKAFYLGAQAGELDYFFVGAVAQPYYKAQNQISDVVAGLSYLCSDPNQKLTQHAAMPPKYVFGFFQGIYGATSVTKAAFSDRGKITNSISFEEVLDGYNNQNIPLEGFTVDIDVQQNYKVFTINDRFMDTDGTPVFLWARKKWLVTQTNITCFIKDSDPTYEVYNQLSRDKNYTSNFPRRRWRVPRSATKKPSSPERCLSRRTELRRTCEGHRHLSRLGGEGRAGVVGRPV